MGELAGYSESAVEVAMGPELLSFPTEVVVQGCIHALSKRFVGNYRAEMMGEMIREHDQGFRTRNSPLLQCLAAQTSPAAT